MKPGPSVFSHMSHRSQFSLHDDMKNAVHIARAKYISHLEILSPRFLVRFSLIFIRGY